jgi:tRNA(Ile2) C34 agmatinyltransferase TiaS
MSTTRKFEGHALGCVITALLVGVVIFAVVDASQFWRFGLAAFVALHVVPILYSKLFRLPCPQCGNKIEMNTMGKIYYRCNECGYEFWTEIPGTPEGNGNWDDWK